MKHCKKCNKYYTSGTHKCKVCGGPLDEYDMVGGANEASLRKEEISSAEKGKKILLCILVCFGVIFGVSYIAVAMGAAQVGIIFLALEYFLLRYLCKFIWNSNREILLDKQETKHTIESVYYYTENSEIMGPCTSQQIKDLNLEDDVLIMNKKDNKWVKYSDIKDSL